MGLVNENETKDAYYTTGFKAFLWFGPMNDQIKIILDMIHIWEYIPKYGSFNYQNLK